MQSAASGPGLVTVLWSVIMVAALRGSALVLLALGLCQGFQPNLHHEEPELTAGASKFGSLWPLPQKIQINEVSFKLSGSTFQITDSPESSAGPSCSLLQNAYRRYYEYMFGGPKKQKMSSDPAELTELQVWITSADSECDGHPSVASDESCESLLPPSHDGAAATGGGRTPPSHVSLCFLHHMMVLLQQVEEGLHRNTLNGVGLVFPAPLYS